MLKAIKTEYDGHPFRSRLEARWAVFFNAMGIKYDYEREGYDLDGLWYLPDFWLPELESFVEIKGIAPSQKESTKAFLLAKHSRYCVYIFSGQIGNGCMGLGYFPSFIGNAKDVRTAPVEWLTCPKCESLNIVPYGQLEFLPCDCVTAAEEYDIEAKTRIQSIPKSAPAPKIISAFSLARAARFEHGEQLRLPTSDRLLQSQSQAASLGR